MSDGTETKTTGKISYTEYCNRTGVSPHIKFYLKKRFPKEKFSEATWKTKIK